MTPVRAALDALGLAAPISSSSLAGGCVHDVRLVELADGERVVCKVASGASGRRMLASELRGLRVLAASASAVTPRVIGFRDGEEAAVLVLEYIPRGHDPDWPAAGRALAALHLEETSDAYGADEEVWLGGTCLPAGRSEDWAHYLQTYRLGPLLRDVVDQRSIDADQANRVEAVLDRLPALIPTTPRRSLLHGDLWAGNLHPNRRGGVVMLDPAAFIGDAWCDPAMTMLFGGIPRAFVGAWRAAYGDEERADARVAVGQLMHLLNHVRLFGSGYVGRCMDCVSTLLGN